MTLNLGLKDEQGFAGWGEGERGSHSQVLSVVKAGEWPLGEEGPPG